MQQYTQGIFELKIKYQMNCVTIVKIAQSSENCLTWVTLYLLGLFRYISKFKIKKIMLDLSKNGKLILPDKLDGITTEIPPSKFNSDISTNVAMVLSKINKKSPIDLAPILVKAIKKNDEHTTFA